MRSEGVTGVENPVHLVVPAFLAQFLQQHLSVAIFISRPWLFIKNTAYG
jgi:hypothetical protein